jgi:hypothetical protein
MTYTAPADHLVYDDDPADTAKLQSSDLAMTSGPNGDVFDFARPWDRLYQLLSPPGRVPAGVLFMHERQNSKGERRLVVVEFRRIGGMKNPLTWPQFSSIVITPGGLFDTPQDHLIEGSQQRIRLDPLARAKWYAGQADAHDPSHFTISGTLDAKPVKLDGWLRDDWVQLSIAP